MELHFYMAIMFYFAYVGINHQM